MADEDRNYLAWIRSLPCCGCMRAAPSQAHHRTGAGMALRAHDHEAMPLCVRCHRDLHDLRGIFEGWKRDKLRLWQAARIRELRQRYVPPAEPVLDDVF